MADWSIMSQDLARPINHAHKLGTCYEVKQTRQKVLINLF